MISWMIEKLRILDFEQVVFFIIILLVISYFSGYIIGEAIADWKN